MARISLIEKPSAACNRILFEQLHDPRQRFDYLRRTIQSSDVRTLKAFVYQGFLQTLYWQIIREYVLAIRGAHCTEQGCASTDGLELHHRNYRYQGEEYKHLDCLEILCRAHHGREYLEKRAKTTEEKHDATLSTICAHHKLALPRSKRNAGYDPRTMMNLHNYGDIRGYRGGADNGQA